MKNLSVANGTYTNSNNEQKTRWVNVGKIMEKDGKEFMLIDPLVNFAAFPREAGKDMVMVGIFEESNNNQQYNQQQNYNNNQQQQNYNAPQQQYNQQQNYNQNQHQQ